MKLSSKISLIALVISTGTAFAADLPSHKSPPVLPQPPLWTGFYAGLNAGYGFGGNNSINTSANAWDQYYAAYPRPAGQGQAGLPWPASYGTFGAIQSANTANGSLNLNGFVGGGQVGYNYQWGNSAVVGLEADIQGTGISSSGFTQGAGLDAYSMGNMMVMPHANRAVFGQANYQASLNWFGTVRGRVGYLITPNLLIFATGGLTYGGANASAQYNSYTQWINTGMIRNYLQTATGNASASSTLVGWNAGGGLEWMLSQNWSVKGEAFYYDLGSLNLSGTAATPPSNCPCQMNTAVPDAQIIYPNTRISYNGVIARAGVNYHFNWATMPVVAKF